MFTLASVSSATDVPTPYGGFAVPDQVSEMSRQQLSQMFPAQLGDDMRGFVMGSDDNGVLMILAFVNHAQTYSYASFQQLSNSSKADLIRTFQSGATASSGDWRTTILNVAVFPSLQRIKTYMSYSFSDGSALKGISVIAPLKGVGSAVIMAVVTIADFERVSGLLENIVSSLHVDPQYRLFPNE